MNGINGDFVGRTFTYNNESVRVIGVCGSCTKKIQNQYIVESYWLNGEPSGVFLLDAEKVNSILSPV